MKKILLVSLVLFFFGKAFSQSYYYTYTAGTSKFTAAIKYNRTPKSGEKKWEITIFDVYDRKQTMTDTTDDPIEISPFLASSVIKIDKAKMNSVLFRDPNRETILQDIYNKFSADIAKDKLLQPVATTPPTAATSATSSETKPATAIDSFTRRIVIDTSYILYIFKKNSTTTITVCNENGNKVKPEPCFSQSIDTSITQADFKATVKVLLQKHYSKPPAFSENVDSKIGDIYTQWKEVVVRAEEKKKNDAEKEELKQRLKIKDSLINSLAAEDIDAGVLRLKDSILALYYPVKQDGKKLKKWGDIRTEYRNAKGRADFSQLGITTNNKFLVIDSITITTLNNTFNQLDIAGKIDGEAVNTITNYEFGIPFRRFIDGRELILFSHKGTKYVLQYSDLFLLRAGNKAGISYTLRDSTYTIINKKPEVPLSIKRMRFLDFISASAFIDLFSLNNQNTNKNLNTEVNIGFPLNHSSLFKRIPKVGGGYLLRQIGMNIWVASDIGDFSNNESGLKSYSLTKPDASGKIITTNYLNNFDLLKNSYLRINPNLNLTSLDVKRWGSFINLDFGLNWFASKVQYIDTLKRTDSLVNKNVFAFSPEINFKWKINPTQNFAADLQIGYLWNLNALTKDIVQVYGGENTQDLAERNRTEGWGRVLKFELNFYFNPNISISNTVRGGWYIKTLYYKSVENVKNHFQFMVGYSSDIKRLFRY